MSLKHYTTHRSFQTPGKPRWGGLLITYLVFNMIALCVFWMGEEIVAYLHERLRMTSQSSVLRPPAETAEESEIPTAGSPVPEEVLVTKLQLGEPLVWADVLEINVTSAAIKPIPGSEDKVCAHISYRNDAVMNFPYSGNREWSVRAPSGEIHNIDLETYQADLMSGFLPLGEEAAGELCFPVNEPGRYVFRYRAGPGSPAGLAEWSVVLD